ncbi:MAG: acetyl-CoA carboxylase biotin carboxyl carrier protein subunit [Dehalococcoidia bacterium]
MAEVRIGGRSYDVEIHGDIVVVDGHEFPVTVKDDGEHLTVTAGAAPYRVQLPPEEERASGMTVHVDYRPFTFEYEGSPGGRSPAPARTAPAAAGAKPAGPAAKGAITAAIAGRVTRVLVKEGDTVEAGDLLLLLEAMKMENEIKAAAAGTVKEVPVAEGQRVTEGETLVVVD